MNILFILHLISGLIQCIKSGSGKRESQLGDGRGRRKTTSGLGRFSLKIVFSCADSHPSSASSTQQIFFKLYERLLLRLKVNFFSPLIKWSMMDCKGFVCFSEVVTCRNYQKIFQRWHISGSSSGSWNPALLLTSCISRCELRVKHRTEVAQVELHQTCDG